MKKYLLMLGLSFNCLYAVKIDNIDAFSSMIKAAEKEEVLEYILNCDESYTSLLTPDKKLYWKDKLDTESLNRIFRDVTEALYQKLSQERFDDIEQKIEDARTHFINIAIQKEQEAQETNKTKQELDRLKQELEHWKKRAQDAEERERSREKQHVHKEKMLDLTDKNIRKLNQDIEIAHKKLELSKEIQDTLENAHNEVFGQSIGIVSYTPRFKYLSSTWIPTPWSKTEISESLDKLEEDFDTLKEYIDFGKEENERKALAKSRERLFDFEFKLKGLLKQAEELNLKSSAGISKDKVNKLLNKLQRDLEEKTKSLKKKEDPKTL